MNKQESLALMENNEQRSSSQITETGANQKSLFYNQKSLFYGLTENLHNCCFSEELIIVIAMGFPFFFFLFKLGIYSLFLIYY